MSDNLHGNPVHTPYPEIPAESTKKVPKKRLTDEQVIAIHRSPISPTILAKQFGVSRRTVYDIKNGTLRRDLGLGPTKKFRELQTERLLGLVHRKPVEKAVTAAEIFAEEGLL